MEKKIQFKAQIKELDLLCEQHKLDFKAIIMTHRQVGDMDRMIMDNEDEYVQMTIEAENKELEIEPIVSNIILEEFKCNARSLKFSAFKCPRDKILTAYDYLDSKAAIIVTIEQLQAKLKTKEEPSLLDGEENPLAGNEDLEPDGFDDNEPGGPDDKLTDGEDKPKDITLNLPPKWNVNCYIKIGKEGDGWQYGYIIKIGNIESSEPFIECVYYDELDDCIYNLKQQLNSFIDAQEGFKQKKPLKKKIDKAIEDWQFDNN